MRPKYSTDTLAMSDYTVRKESVDDADQPWQRPLAYDSDDSTLLFESGDEAPESVIEEDEDGPYTGECSTLLADEDDCDQIAHEKKCLGEVGSMCDLVMVEFTRRNYYINEYEMICKPCVGGCFQTHGIVDSAAADVLSVADYKTYQLWTEEARMLLVEYVSANTRPLPASASLVLAPSPEHPSGLLPTSTIEALASRCRSEVDVFGDIALGYFSDYDYKLDRYGFITRPGRDGRVIYRLPLQAAKGVLSAGQVEHIEDWTSEATELFICYIDDHAERDYDAPSAKRRRV